MEPKLLSEIGLTERESKVYLALLEIGTTTTGPLIKKSGVPNSKIYEVLESLQNKGLVSWIIEGKTKHFQAAEPKKILSLFEEKRRTIEQAIPQLEIMMKKSEEKGSVEFFDGLNAIRGFYIDLFSEIEHEEYNYGFTKGEPINNTAIQEFYKFLATQKKDKKIIDHLMVSSQYKKEFSAQYQVQQVMHKKWKLRFSDVSFPGDVGIFKDKVILLNWNPSPFAVVITNNALAKQYLEFFTQLWANAVPYKP